MAKVKVYIKSLAYRPGLSGLYRSGTMQVLDAELGRTLVAAGIATMMEDPVMSSVPIEDDGTNKDEKGSSPGTIDGSASIGDGKLIGGTIED